MVFVLTRLRSQHTEDNRRKDLLHVLRPGGNSAQSRHVPEHRRASQHLRHLRPSSGQALPQTRRAGLADAPHSHRHHHVLPRRHLVGQPVYVLHRRRQVGGQTTCHALTCCHVG